MTSLEEISLEPYDYSSKGKEEAEEIQETEKQDLNNEATPGPSMLPSYTDLEAASKEDGKKWAQAYTKLMNVSIKQAYHLVVSKGWTLVENPSSTKDTKDILLYDAFAQDGNCMNYYKLKARGVFKVRPERLHYVIKDHDQDTRGRWDTEHLVSCKQLETFWITDTARQEKIDVVSSEHKMNIPFVSNRACLGIQWSGFDEMTGVYKYVFRTTQHRLHRPNQNAIAVQGLAASFVRILEDDQNSDEEPECDLTVVLHCNIGDKFPLMTVNQWAMKEWLRKRIALYVHVAQNWDTYYKPEDNPKTNRK